MDCFFLEPTDLVRQSLRRFVFSTAAKCPLPHGYHDASEFIGDQPANLCPGFHEGKPLHGDLWPHADPAWPKACRCGYVFQEGDEWQYNPDLLFRRSDTGELTTLRDAPPGAMWHADWMGILGPDGHTLAVRLPDGHDWTVDGRASNCTKPDDKMHRCWCRHGTVPKITVDKNGNTCQAGAGSILTPNWHGFLIDGQLRAC